MRSVVRSGPTLVTQSNSVPTPERCSVRNRMDSASRIQSTWRSTRSMPAHTCAGGASIVMQT
jgi:hypothetical protein